ncbi:MAG: SsrA-binding protein [candidate division Zixibacteria bacterium CG_4_9_14_3_um_filter_46_8]|nr:MAG: SsrA-binding protein [candidate division Zixibacteria bacterium CG_4_9_14_3_um_filter_46_8]
MVEGEKRIKVIVTNRKARHLYHILDTYEAGMALVGTEVKSLRSGKVNLSDSYAEIREGQAFLIGLHISPYEQANRQNHDPIRDRRLLLTKREIRKLFTKTQEKGLTLVPLKIYFKGPYAKVELGVAKGKQLFDHREDIKKRDAERETRRAKKHSQY